MLFPIVQVHHLNRVGIRPTFIFSSCHTLLLRKPMCMNVLVSSREHFIKELLSFAAAFRSLSSFVWWQYDGRKKTLYAKCM